MTEAELTGALRALGLDHDSWRALSLLPLVQVAWADGKVQQAERDLILGLASERYSLTPSALAVLGGWLERPPSPGDLRLAHAALVELNRLSPDPGSSLRDVIGYAVKVAEAAGHLPGASPIAREEAQLVDEVAQALDIDPERPWVTSDDVTMVRYDADNEAAGPSPEVVFQQVVGSSPGCLVRYDLAEGEQSCPVTGAGLTIGRSDSNTVRIFYDGEVSRQHCRLFLRDGRFFIEDLHSANGTWVNGERVSQRRLFGGEQIHVGSASFFFQFANR